MGVFGKRKHEAPPRRDEDKLLRDNIRISDKSMDSSINSKNEGQKNEYEPPSTFTIINRLAAKSNNADSSAAASADAAMNKNSTQDSSNSQDKKAALEILRPVVESKGSRPRKVQQDDEDRYDDVVMVSTNSMAHSEYTAKVATGCCGSEAFELEYDKDRFHCTTKQRKTIPDRLTSFSRKISTFSHRLKSYREDQIANSHASRLLCQPREEDETLSSAGSSISYGYYDDETELTEDDRFSGVYQHFGSIGRGLGKRQHSKSTKHTNDTSFASSRSSLPGDVLSNLACNEYARRQYEIWRAAAIEGPTIIKVASFVVTLVLIINALGIVLVKRKEDFWTPGAIVALCHLFVSSMLILVLESRTNLAGKGNLIDLVTCGCSSVEDDLMDDRYLARATVLPMEAYHVYGENCENNCASRLRHKIVRSVGLFRYGHGRGLLYIFAGFMTISTIPGHLEDYPNVTMLLCIPGATLLWTGFMAIVAGVHATFRWTLLKTSIVGDDDHLRDKFRSARLNILDESHHTDIDSIRLDRDGFTHLVTTLGLDLDAEVLIPAVYTLEVGPKDPEGITFEEFRKWWRGKDAPRKHPSSPVRSRGKRTPTSSLPSSCTDSLA